MPLSAAFEVKHDRRSLLRIVARAYKFYRSRLSEQITETNLGMLPRCLLPEDPAPNESCSDVQEVTRIVLRNRPALVNGSMKSVPYYWVCQSEKCSRSGVAKLIRLTRPFCSQCAGPRPCMADGKPFRMQEQREKKAIVLASTCSKCKKSLPEGSRFCCNCGAKCEVIKVSEPAQPSSEPFRDSDSMSEMPELWDVDEFTLKKPPKEVKKDWKVRKLARSEYLYTIAVTTVQGGINCILNDVAKINIFCLV